MERHIWNDAVTKKNVQERLDLDLVSTCGLCFIISKYYDCCDIIIIIIITLSYYSFHFMPPCVSILGSMARFWLVVLRWQQRLMFISKALYQKSPSYHSILFMFRNNKYLTDSWDWVFWEISPMQNLTASLNQSFRFAFLSLVFTYNNRNLFVWFLCKKCYSWWSPQQDGK